MRDPADFAAAHLTGSVNVGLGGRYATRAGTVFEHERPIVIVAEPGREREAAMRLGRIGFDNVAGHLDGGMQALSSRPDLVGRIERMSAVTLAARLAGPEPPIVLDVRTPREWEERRIAGSLNVPLGRLRERLDELPRDRELVVQCATSACARPSLIRRPACHRPRCARMHRASGRSPAKRIHRDDLIDWSADRLDGP